MPDASAPDSVPRILVVDDEEPVRMVISQMLRAVGYEAVVAASGQEALELTATKGPFELVVTDLMMPGMTGDELGRQLRLREPDQKILYLTAYADSLFRDRALLWSGEAFLEKPCTLNGLREAISLLLYGKVE